MHRSVDIRGQAILVAVESRPANIWLATGVFRGQTLKAQARSADRAVENWAAIARLCPPGG